MTSGGMVLSQNPQDRIFATVRDYDDFTADNDPHGEHGFGKLTVDGHAIIWKIDYYDLRREFLSPDPTAPSVTWRVLTIMLAGEW